MVFDWQKFDRHDFVREFSKTDARVRCIGCVHVGGIAIDLVCNETMNAISCDFYVAYEDTGYGYSGDIAYDYAGGCLVNVVSGDSYENFKIAVENACTDAINNYRGDYSLVDHANRETLIW